MTRKNTRKVTKDKKLIGTKWIFKIKEEKIMNTRLVATKFQVEEEENCYSLYAPVARMSTIRIMAIALQRKWIIK